MNKLAALIATCDVIRGIIAGRGRKRENCPEKFRTQGRESSPSPLARVSLVFRCIRGCSYPVRSQAVFSPSLSRAPPPRVPFSLSHFPVGCYCRVSSPSLIKSFVLRRGRRAASPSCSPLPSAAVQRKIYPGEYFENKRRLVFSSSANSRPRQIHIKAV